jgi:outer membrane protein OmpA-like peptidoglycan-associated protein
MSMYRHLSLALTFGFALSVLPCQSVAQDVLPYDNGIDDYHTSPRYRESESHPLRVIAYALHPIGWVARELIFRPLSYFASSTETTRSVMGYREPYDFRKPSCFSARDVTPDCRQVVPFNYDMKEAGALVEAPAPELGQAIYFPDTNFDFNKRTLNNLGIAKVKTAAEILNREGGVKVVLEGHTDARGNDKYNEKLGLDRAEAVKVELEKLGIPSERLSTVSFGETKPLFSEEAEWAYAANRRVEVHVAGKEGEVQAPAVAASPAKVEAKPSAAKAAPAKSVSTKPATAKAEPAPPELPKTISK